MNENISDIFCRKHTSGGNIESKDQNLIYI